MKIFDTQNIKNIVLLGSTKSGKTTLAETMMFEGGVINRRGSVEDGNTVSDFSDIEQEKGYSIYASLMHTIWRENKINIIDTPGNDNFIGETLAGLRAADGVVLVLNSNQGVEIGTEVLWRYIKDKNKPVVIACNQLDHEKANFDETLEQARNRIGSQVIPMQYPYNSGDDFNCIIDLLKMIMYKFGPEGGKPEKVPIPDEERAKADELHNELVEAAAENDESLMELYFDKGELDEDEMRQGLRLGILHGDVIPMFCMSAKLNMGSGRMMGFIGNVFPSASDYDAAKTVDDKEVACDANGKPSVFVWKMNQEQHLGDVSYFKVKSGTISSGLDMVNARTGNSERFGSVYTTIGKKKEQIEKLVAGDIGAVVKLKDSRANDTYSTKGDEVEFPAIVYPEYRLRTAVKANDKNDEEKLGEALNYIARQDPTLLSGYSGELRQTILSGQGEMHLQVVNWYLEKQFKLKVGYIKPRISYRETIQGSAKADYRHKKQSGGSGQFGQVYIQLDPYVEGAEVPPEYKIRQNEITELKTGGVLQFINSIVGGAIDARFIPAVKKGIMETMVEGPMTGSPVRDVRIILYDGKMHPVDSNEISFKIASSQAFKQAFSDAKPKLLEPIFDVEVLTPDDVMGDVMTDLQNRRAIIMGMGQEGNFQKIMAKVPLAELYKYATSLRSLTQGRAIHTRKFADYSLVQDNIKDEILKEFEALKED